MKSVLRFVGQALAIVAITLALDFIVTATLFSDLKKSWAEAARPGVYMPAAHHHDLVPDREITRVWGRVRYPWKTDRFGFRTGTCAPGEPEKGREAIFVVGDSFTEALGSTYEQSFVGLMACDAAKQGKAVYNLGVASYSPAIYHQKIRAAAERLGITPAEIFVFLDLSDIDDDANVYRACRRGRRRAIARPAGWSIPWDEIGRFFVNNFAVVHLVHDLSVASSFNQQMSFGRPRARWAFDPVLLESWGRRGLEVAGGNLDKVVATLPRLEMPRDPGGLSLAGQCRGGRPRQSAGAALARLGGGARRALRRRLRALLPRARRGGDRHVLHPRRRPFHRGRQPAALRRGENGTGGEW